MSILNSTLEYTSISIAGTAITHLIFCAFVSLGLDTALPTRSVDLRARTNVHFTAHDLDDGQTNCFSHPFLHAEQNIISSRNTTQDTIKYSDWATMTNNAAMTRLLLRTRLPCGSQPNRGRKQPRFTRLYIWRALRPCATSLRLIHHLCGFLLLPIRLLVSWLWFSMPKG